LIVRVAALASQTHEQFAPTVDNSKKQTCERPGIMITKEKVRQDTPFLS